MYAPVADIVEVYDNASKPRGRALFLAADGVLRSSPELLALPGTAKAGATVRIHSGDGVASYWVRESLEGSPSFVRYALAEMSHGLE